MADLFAAGIRLAPRDAPGRAECAERTDTTGDTQLRSDRERSHFRLQRFNARRLPRREIEVKLTGAVVRVSAGMADAVQLTAVLRAIRASASRS